MSERWYAAQTKSGAAASAEYNLVDQGYSVFFPRVKERSADGKKIKVMPLFPGYIFVALDLAVKRWRSVNNTRGVKRLLPLHREIPEHLPLGFVDDLRDRWSRGELDVREARVVAHKYSEGEVCRVETEDAWNGNYGTFKRMQSGSVVLMMSLFAGAQQYERAFLASQVHPANPVPPVSSAPA